MAMAAEGPPMPVEQTVTFCPSKVPVHTLNSRLQATWAGCSKYRAMG